MHGKGKSKEKRTRPSSSTTEEHEECSRHDEELLKLYKTLEQKDAEKSVAIAGLQALLAAAKDEIKVLNDKVVAPGTSLIHASRRRRGQRTGSDVRERANKTRKRANPPKHL